MPMRVMVDLYKSEWEKLRALALEERRTLRDQAAVLIARALRRVEPPEGWAGEESVPCSAGGGAA